MRARDILRQVAHRPWPLPVGPWIMRQTWNELLFAHWPVPAADLAALLPAGLTVDTYDGQAWLGVVPFRMSGVRPRGVPAILWLSAFPELNVRTYVTAGGKPGVWFFSLDATNALAVSAARATFHLPYFTARMRCDFDGAAVAYASHRTHRGSAPADFQAVYRPIGSAYTAQAGSLEHWLTERYCLYALSRRGHVLRGEIHHAPWLLQPAEAEIRSNTMARAAGLSLPDTPPLLHYAARQDTLVWLPYRVSR